MSHIYYNILTNIQLQAPKIIGGRCGHHLAPPKSQFIYRQNFARETKSKVKYKAYTHKTQKIQIQITNNFEANVAQHLEGLANILQFGKQIHYNNNIVCGDFVNYGDVFIFKLCGARPWGNSSLSKNEPTFIIYMPAIQFQE